MIQHRIVRSHRRTISIEIAENGLCIVRAPSRISQRAITSFIASKQHWIVRHQKRMRAKYAARPQYRFVSGETFPVFGMYRALCIVSPNEQCNDLIFHNRLFHLRSDARPRAKHVFQNWYKRNGLAILEKATMRYAMVIGENPRSVAMSGAECQWGSCGHNGVIRFSWRVSLAPIPIAHAIVAHEVAHLLEKNHSRRFYAILKRLCPEYDIHNAWLKEYGDRLIV